MTSFVIDRPEGPINVKTNGHRRPLVTYLDLPDGVGPEWFDYVAAAGECEGHESLDGAHMGETVYCDGSCVMTPFEWAQQRFFCYRGSWYDLYDGFEADGPTWLAEAGFDAWQTESAFSAVIVQHFAHTEPERLLDDGDSVIVGYAHW